MDFLRFPNESDDAFLARASHIGIIAKCLVEACFKNHLVERLLAEGRLAEESIRKNPTVRVEFEQAIAIGGVGETLNATRNKHWGDGPWIMPLEPDDEFFTDRITYLYRPNSVYNRRFEQRNRLKQLLGKNHRKLVSDAKYFTKEIFLKRLTKRQTQAIQQILGTSPEVFWRAAQGKIFLTLPSREIQREFDFGVE